MLHISICVCVVVGGGGLSLRMCVCMCVRVGGGLKLMHVGGRVGGRVVWARETIKIIIKKMGCTT